ncbi:hypothetical protein E4Z66_00630 [Aliishimia ponticola]|uniref:Asp-tRNA(Asn)/Glu-tRNA(Gln) amidotransferase GatCAB subunit C n=1 Tax=Aliishimia ponticola TaxID=2499833 RepID=A0A4S4NEY9_9RHOB|nr:molybdopterin-dependent oxidoreductase [Aliishimia ponticola]THH38116.1 hypothetical protein E4Z66_00630 [Aliishimia ponticola]
MTRQLTSNHWGLGLVRTQGGRITDIAPHPADPSPSALNDNMAASLGGRARVLRPAVRKGWLEGRRGTRGEDPFVELDWSEMLDLIAGDLTRVRKDHGNEAIFAGSYGWGSAGRFHHAQSQLKRFLNSVGGFVGSDGNYSYNAALVTMPHILGGGFRQHLAEATRWPVIARHTDLIVAFGGLALRNMQICDGGNAIHRIPQALKDCAARGVRCVNLSPFRGDMADDMNAEWLAPRPGSDVAVMLALAHTLLVEGLHDRAFLDRYTTGFDRVEAYLTGADDGQPKSAEWAGAISGLDPDRLRRLARQMAGGRTLITCAAGLQRADWGEQPLFAVVTLAAMLGQIGLPGGGYTVGYAVNGHVGAITRPVPWGALPQGTNPIAEQIPVAMIAEMLLNPGGAYRAEGRDRIFPDTRLLWWAGGNPFHHHQDLNRLRRAFQYPETVIVNEINWTATARHADIVLPVAAATEREDFGAGKTDNVLVPMPRLVPPPGQARTEYEIYTDLADRLGTRDAFTEGLDTEGWLRRLWAQTQSAAERRGLHLPEWEEFRTGDIVVLPDPAPDQVFLADYRADPVADKRATPSGKIELFSQVVADCAAPDCPGHAVWRETRDRQAGLAERYPLALLSGQPATRLHSQFDNGDLSRSQKVAGREPVLIHPEDARDRGIADGDVVELFNDRGRCLAGARLTPDIARGCVFLWTGAWYDPDFDAPHARDRHGNPNVLTHDLRTSTFSQSPAAHSAQVDAARWTGPVPPITVFDPPIFAPRVDGT